MGQAHKKLSMIIPCHNAEKYLRQCFDSIKDQSGGLDDIEVIFVDDASDDNGRTVALLSQFQKEIPDIQVICNETNKRQGGARNTGLKYASGDYIGFLDADDYLVPDYCEKLLKTAYESDADILQFGHYNFCDKEDGQINILETVAWPNDIITIESMRQRKDFVTGSRITLGCWNKLYRREMIEDANVGFGENVVYEEPLFTYPLKYYVNRVALTDNCLYYCRQHEASTMKKDMKSFSTIKDHMSVCVQLLDFMRATRFYDEFPQEIDFRFIHSYLMETLVFCGQRGLKMSLEDYEDMRKTFFEKIGKDMQNIYAPPGSLYDTLFGMIKQEGMTEDVLDGVILAMADIG